MTAHGLAKILLAGPDLKVRSLWNGAARTTIEHVWLAKGGKDYNPFIATAGHSEVVYYDDDRPAHAPLQTEDRYWTTPNR